MEPLQGTATGRELGPAKVSYTHDAMIDLMLMRPGISQQEIALYFNYTPNWVSRVVGSDSFQARLAQRKDEIVTPAIRENLEDRMAALADQSLDILQNKLKATSSPDLAFKALELSTKALGLGARAATVQNTQNNTYVVALPSKVPDEQTWAAQAKQQVSPVRPAQGVVDVEAKPASANASPAN